MILTSCEHCGVALPRAARGRPARYCSPAHRVAAHRARRTVPAELTERARWVRYSKGKVPLQPESGLNASSTKPRTWSSHEVAQASPYGVGCGFVLNGDGIVCLDLDGCLQGGRLTEWAAELLGQCPATFVEVSPSGTGLHVWGTGSIETGRKIRDHRNVEAYGQGRYIATTGKRWRGAPLQLADLSGVLAELV